MDLVTIFFLLLKFNRVITRRLVRQRSNCHFAPGLLLIYLPYWFCYLLNFGKRSNYFGCENCGMKFISEIISSSADLRGCERGLVSNESIAVATTTVFVESLVSGKSRSRSTLDLEDWRHTVLD